MSHAEAGPIALAALEHYEIDLERCEPLSDSYNTFFRVDASDGSRFALRISPARRIHRLGSDEVEAAWLDALNRDGVVTVPRFVRTRDGAASIDASADGATPRRCSLMTWVEGRRLSDAITPDGVREMGRIAARLHDHAGVGVTFDPASVPAFDRVVYWELETRFDELTREQRSVVEPALERAGAAIEALWADPPHGPHLLHDDIGPGNVLVSTRDTAMLDFEDLIVGFETQDLSITVADLRRHHGDPELESAFRAGYGDERTWPDVDDATFEALVAARWLHQIDLGLNLRKPGLEAYVEELVARIDAPGPR